MRVVAIIQVRAGSTRLPNKAFLLLAGKSMTQNIIERVQRATKLDQVVLAFPHTGTDADTTFAALAVQCGISYYLGVGVEENDLVGRYLAAAKCYDADIIVRIPGDNPCVEPCRIDEAIQKYLGIPCVMLTNTTDRYDKYERRVWVDGVGCEVYSYNRLQWLDRFTVGFNKFREHPHKWFIECNYFSGTNRPQADVRLDINTQADYDFIADIYSHFGHNRFTVEEVLGYLDSKQVSA